jgi:hypothetical protein
VPDQLQPIFERRCHPPGSQQQGRDGHRPTSWGRPGPPGHAGHPGTSKFLIKVIGDRTPSQDPDRALIVLMVGGVLVQQHRWSSAGSAANERCANRKRRRQRIRADTR